MSYVPDLMGRVKAIVFTTRGRFVDVELENVPKGPNIRFRVPSESLQCEERVKIHIELYVAKPKEVSQP